MFTGVAIVLMRMATGNLGDWKSLGGGLCERRIHFGPGYRVYFGIEGGRLLIFGGGTKVTQPRDIRLARARWTDFRRHRMALVLDPEHQ